MQDQIFNHCTIASHTSNVAQKFAATTHVLLQHTGQAKEHPEIKKAAKREPTGNPQAVTPDLVRELRERTENKNTVKTP